MKKIILLIGLALFMSCVQQPQKTVLQGLVQGSYYAITYYDDLGRNFQVEVDSIFHAVDLSVNLWVDSSLICKVNRNEEVCLDSIFIDNFEIAQEAARISNGYFDPTVSPLVAAWGFSNKEGDSITPQLIDSLRGLVDYRKIRIEKGKVVKENPNMKLDFNAIAQGYTSDMVAFFLDSKGVERYIVDIGGEIFARGCKPDGSPWIVGVEKPAANWDAGREVQQRVSLSDKGIVTSGGYRKYVERDGKRYSHCIDPKTGYPVDHNLLSVTVVANNAVWADALASICMVMGMERSLELVNSLQGVEAYYIYVNADNALETYATDGFNELLME